jgi:uncharacterized protein
MTTALKKTFWIFVMLTSIHMMTVTWGFLQQALPDLNPTPALLYHFLVWASYSIIYVLLALTPVYLLVRFVPTMSKLIAVSAVVLSSAVLQFMQADLMIYDLYNFHFNGFIWNLVTTAGGVSSLGSGKDTYISIMLSVLFTVLVQCALWAISNKLSLRVAIRGRHLAWLIIPMFFVQALMYGVSDVKNYGPILSAVQTYPFYKKVTFRGVAEKLGFKAVRSNENKLSIDTSRIQYPLKAFKYEAVENPPNIVLLVTESLRWDRLTPEIMPNTWKLAQKSQFFKAHYSGGNGTREGLFGLFYGLYGSYWNSFLYAQRSPLLMDRLQELSYQFDLRTSARFSYPEFNKTLFAKIPLDQLHEESADKAPWQRDRDNASGLIKFIEGVDRTKPFMSFFFFESTHARYDFPETDIIAEPYLKDVNYWGMSRKSLAPKIGEFKNRYTNAAHWVDIQMGRIYDSLEQQGLLDNTIIVVTGDHGEEFLEKGFWGHNSSFVEEQTHVPMVMWVPKLAHQEFNTVTSHLDVGTTLLQMLGAPENSNSYSLGANMLSVPDRKFIVVSDWHSISVLTSDMKYRIPYVTKGFDRWQPTGNKDEELSEAQSQALLAKNQQVILEAIKNSSKFLAIKNN